MNKKEYLFPILLILLTVVFVGVSLAVILTRGKSAKWVNRKMKIGALMLSMTLPSLAGAQVTDSLPPVVTCYYPVILNEMTINNSEGKMLKIQKRKDKIIKGNITSRVGNNFSYSIKDSSGNEVQAQEVLPADGNFDSYTEDFEIEINRKIKHGEYILYLYSMLVSEQTKNNHTAVYKLNVR